MKRSVIDLVEGCYRLDGDETTWLRGLVDAAEQFFAPGFWVAGWTYEFGADAQPVIRALASPRGGEEAKQRILAASLLAPRDHSRSYFAPRVCISLADAFGGVGNLKRAPFWRPEWRCNDLVMVKSLDITGRGCMLFSPAASRTRVSAAMEARWRLVLAHANAGMRLRAGLERDQRSPADTAEAVLEPDGRAVHAAGQAEGRDARKFLREAVKQMDRSRGARRWDEPDAALSAWKGLVTGRWSLVDHFESDGRRYILARRNDPQVGDPRALTLQERQVARYAAYGLANRYIAYTLGVSEARVSQALRTAVRKLGLRDRAELVRTLASGREGEPSDGGRTQ